MYVKKIHAFLLGGVLLCTGCGTGSTAAEGKAATSKETETASESENSSESTEKDSSEQTSEQVSDSAENGLVISDMFSDRDKEIGYDEEDCAVITLADKGSSCDSDAVSVSGNTVTIQDEGTYILRGTLSDGMIIVEGDEQDKVQLVLDGVDITSEESAAIYVRSADKVFLTTAADSENTLTNGGTYTAIDDNNIDGVIFSKADLTLNGAGTLKVHAESGHGVVSKDDLVLTSGEYEINAASHGLSGKDSVRIAEGTCKITAGEDGIHSSNSEDEGKGFIYLAGGNFEITAEDDGIHAESALQIDGGKIDIQKCKEGLEGKSIDVTGGEITLTAEDDGLNAAGEATAEGMPENPEGGAAGSMEPPKEAEASTQEQPEASAQEQSEEGMPKPQAGNEGSRPELPEGMTGSRPEGSGGQDGGEFKGGGDLFAVEEGVYIHISGGSLHVSASGDGIDSNGTLTISGGDVYVSGPENNGNGSLDCNGDALISGGTFAAAGFSGMAQNFSSSSAQGAILVTVEEQEAGSVISLTDSDGAELVSWEAEKAFDCVQISVPELKKGETYTLTAGDAKQEITMESLIYGEDVIMGGQPRAKKEENLNV